MRIPDFDPEAAIDAMAPLLGLDVAPDSRDAVALNLGIAARLAALLLSEPLGDQAEPAPIFLPAEVAA